MGNLFFRSLPIISIVRRAQEKRAGLLTLVSCPVYGSNNRPVRMQAPRQPLPSIGRVPESLGNERTSLSSLYRNWIRIAIGVRY
jgi:hypothetical protein